MRGHDTLQAARQGHERDAAVLVFVFWVIDELSREDTWGRSLSLSGPACGVRQYRARVKRGRSRQTASFQCLILAAACELHTHSCKPEAAHHFSGCSTRCVPGPPRQAPHLSELLTREATMLPGPARS